MTKGQLRQVGPGHTSRIPTREWGAQEGRHPVHQEKGGTVVGGVKPGKAEKKAGVDRAARKRHDRISEDWIS